MRLLALIGGLVLLSSTAHAAAMLKPGDSFPAWTLVDQTGAAVTSQELAGKTQ